MALMNLNLLLLLLLGLGAPVGSEVSLQKRIIKGQDCSPDERLFHVRLVSSNATSSSWCGGSLISSEWILTAAHCWEWGRGWSMTATLGVHPRNAKQQVNRIILFSPVVYIDDDGRQHDIMLLKLKDPVKNIKPVQLPDCGDPKGCLDFLKNCIRCICPVKGGPKIGDTVQLAGEAATQHGPNYEEVDMDIPANLQCVDMKVVKCPLNDLWYYGHEHRFCASAKGTDICSGDSGGGVLFKDKIYGVNSFSGKLVCQRSVGIMDVCSYRAWIKEITGV